MLAKAAGSECNQPVALAEVLEGITGWDGTAFKWEDSPKQAELLYLEGLRRQYPKITIPVASLPSLFSPDVARELLRCASAVLGKFELVDAPAASPLPPAPPPPATTAAAWAPTLLTDRALMTRMLANAASSLSSTAVGTGAGGYDGGPQPPARTHV
jgi:hypothetical protein